MPYNNQQYQQPIPQGGVFFDFVSSESIALNYLVSPGNTVFLYDQQNQVLYEKTYNSMQAYDLVKREVQVQPTEQANQNGSTSLTKDEILQLIREEIRQYNPHIPKKDRRAN